MNKYYYLNVVSIEKNIFSGKVNEVHATGIEGELSIFPGHAHLITIIKPGMMKIFPIKKQEIVIYLSGGILEIQPNIVTVLSDIVIRGKNLDEIQVIKIKKESEKNLIKTLNNNPENFNISLNKLSEALAKLRIIELLKNKKTK